MKKTLYTFLLISSLLFVYSCEDEEHGLTNTLCGFPSTSFSNLDTPIYIPNVFTPNGDGINDIWKPVTIAQIEAYNFIIYNSLGIEVYSSSISYSWDGECNNEPCIDGEYNYSVSFDSQTATGGISLVRDTYNPSGFLNFPVGLESCFFGDQIDPNYGFVFQTDENLDEWGGD